MKTVYCIKDTHQNNTFRVSYFEKDTFKKIDSFEFDEETQEIIKITKQQYYDKLLFCQRLEWNINENELDDYIEEVRLYWENRINT